MKYDYIIAGAGCAGLSLVYKLLKTPELSNKSILIVDKDAKEENDRTWCFWEKETGPFQNTVIHEWNRLTFKNDKFTNTFDLKGYTYKMIRGIDFYNHVLQFIEQFDNVIFVKDEIKSFDVIENTAILKTANQTFKANYIFNSTGLMQPELSSKNTLLQHFLGWEIKTSTPFFNEKEATLMDFSVSQHHGTTFMYVLPTSKHTALVEYTLFTGELIPKEEYRKAIKAYIENDIQLKEYEISHEEFGIIPMSSQQFPLHSKQQIIHIGTAGGNTKASSGYTFQFIQKNTDSIVEKLRNDITPIKTLSLRDKMFQWYDNTLIEVIISGSMSGKEIFSRMFKKLSPEKILKFLDNESSITEDIKIMTSLPIQKFLPAGIKQLFQTSSK